MVSRESEKKLANLIIAGVNKAGSTSLFHYLSAHPDICGSLDKETCYFLPLLYGRPIDPLSTYAAQFEHCGASAYRLEATPGYINGGEIIANTIHDTLPGVKIIILLKDPVDRLISFYKRKKATLQLPASLTFREYVETCFAKTPEQLRLKEHHLYSAVATGKYSDVLEPWLKIFGPSMKILFFDDMAENTPAFMNELSKWLEIDPAFYGTYNFDIKNKSMNYRNQLVQQIAVNANKIGQRFWRTRPRLKKNLVNIYYKMNGTSFAKDDIDRETVSLLRNFYRPHNNRLQQLLADYGYNANIPAWVENEIELV